MSDVLPDGRRVELLAHPFDQYQRYQDICQVVEALREHTAHPSFRILDVGGTRLSQRFLPKDRVVPINLERNPAAQLLGDGARLPFADGRFDVAITVDTLEHVPGPHRAAFLAELLRVAAQYIIVTGPFANDYNEVAEGTLMCYLTETLGLQHRFLSEHLEYGLPDLDETLSIIAHHGAELIAIPSGYVTHWLPLMIIRQRLAQLAAGQDITAELELLYNTACYWSDHRPPSYRQVVVAALPGTTTDLAHVEQVFQRSAAETPIDLNGVLALWQALRWQTLLKEHEDERRRLQSDRDRLQAENQRLQQLVANYQSGRFMRFMAGLKQMLSAWR